MTDWNDPEESLKEDLEREGIELVSYNPKTGGIKAKIKLKEPMTDEQIKNIVREFEERFGSFDPKKGDGWNPESWPKLMRYGEVCEHDDGFYCEHRVNKIKDFLTQSLQKYGEKVREETEEAIFNTLKQDKEVARELPHPIEAIKFRMEQSGLKQKDMLPYFGTRGRVSEVLNLVRPLTIRMIRRLVAGLDIPAEVLIQKYELTSLTKQEKGQR